MKPIEGATALLFAAGLGTRLKPFTDHHPKALARVNGRTLLERNISYLRSFGIARIVVNVHHFADQIIDEIATLSDPSSIIISHEQEQPLETGGGLVYARPHLMEGGRPFVVMNVDILTDLDLNRLYAAHQQSDAVATLAVTSRASTRQFLFDSTMRLWGWKNNTTSEYRWSDRALNDSLAYSFSGVHIISPRLFHALPTGGVFPITDSYIQLAAHHLIKGMDHTGDAVIDVGRPESIAIAEAHFG